MVEKKPRHVHKWYLGKAYTGLGGDIHTAQFICMCGEFKEVKYGS